MSPWRVLTLRASRHVERSKRRSREKGGPPVGEQGAPVVEARHQLSEGGERQGGHRRLHAVRADEGTAHGVDDLLYAAQVGRVRPDEEAAVADLEARALDLPGLR